MDRLLAHEIELLGRWVEQDGKIREDAVCERITRLTDGVLDIVQDHPMQGGWRRLYRDRGDGRYWERSYPASDLHGGGPFALRWISDEEVATEYGFRPYADMVDKIAAEALAENAIREIAQRSGEPLVMLRDQTATVQDGWVFFYQSEEYIRTGDFGAMLAGNAPIHVRHDGVIRHLETGQPWEEQIEC